MRSTSLDATDADYLRRARELGPELDAAAEEIERRRELPEAIVEALVERGLFRLLLPRNHGGAELRPAAYVSVIEEVAKHDASAAWCLGQACGCTMTSAYLDPAVAPEIFGGKRGIVAWGPPGPAEARTVPGGYRLTGTWSFASGSHHATWLGAHVAILDPNGALQLRPDGSPVMRTLLCPQRARRFCRACPRQDPARRQAHLARQQCDPGAGVSVRSAAQWRARLSAELSRRNLAGCWRLGATHNGSQYDNPARLNLGHPPGTRGRRHRVSCGGCHSDLRQQP